MAELKPFTPAKLIVSIIASKETYSARAEEDLRGLFGAIDLRSPLFPFDLTTYYEKQMGRNLKRIFLSFVELVSPETLSGLKIQTNSLEQKIKQESGESFRVVNIDPGILTASALIMATAKDFAHRVPLAGGIYAHLEYLFTKTGVKFLEWTYPDMRQDGCRRFFLDVRGLYLGQLKNRAG